jgi:hypothetical protein
MPKKFVSCVRKVRKRYPTGQYNPFAICRVSTGYYGKTRHIGLLNPLRRKRDE